MPGKDFNSSYRYNASSANETWRINTPRCVANYRISRYLLVSGLLFVCAWSEASSYTLPTNGNSLVGGIQIVQVRAEETLLDIARRFGLGYNEITAANPDVDPWLPEHGRHIIVPTWFVLPQPPWKGIVINLAELRLYYFPQSKVGEARKVITYPLSIGRQYKPTPQGKFKILMKIKNPNWTMPEEAYARALANGVLSPQRVIPAGPDNPLGEYAMRLNNDGLFLHGTNRPFGIGMRVSSGCLRLYPEDIRQLVTLVPLGTSVRIVDQPYKVGNKNGILFMETHIPKAKRGTSSHTNLTPIVSALVNAGIGELSSSEWDHIIGMANHQTGVPTAIYDKNTASLNSIH